LNIAKLPLTFGVIIFSMTDQNALPEAGLETAVTEQSPEKRWTNKTIYWIIGIFAGLIVLSIISAVVVSQPNVDSGRVRDFFLIMMVLVSFIVSVSLVILLIQVSLLVNLLNNEIRPVLANLIDSVNDLKGTTAFLSENLVEPVIKLNEYLAGLKRLMDILRPFRK
jgi:ABC-type sugar transport system permease subunit